MSWYSDVTIADIQDVLSVVRDSPDPLAMGARILAATSDPDLAQLLTDMATDCQGVAPVGGMWAARELRRIAEAAQGIEDGLGFSVTVQTGSDGVSLTVTPISEVQE